MPFRARQSAYVQQAALGGPQPHGVEFLLVQTCRSLSEDHVQTAMSDHMSAIYQLPTQPLLVLQAGPHTHLLQSQCY